MNLSTIEKLVKLAKQGIAEVGLTEFKSAIISSKNIDAESIKKEPEGSDFNSSTCIKWWTFRNDIRTFSPRFYYDNEHEKLIIYYNINLLKLTHSQKHVI